MKKKFSPKKFFDKNKKIFALGGGYLVLLVTALSFAPNVLFQTSGQLQANLIGPIGSEVQGFELTFEAEVTENEETNDEITISFGGTFDETFPGTTDVDGVGVVLDFPDGYEPVNPTITNNSDGTLFDPVTFVDVGDHKRATITFYDLDLSADADLFDFTFEYAAFEPHSVSIYGEVLTETLNVHELGTEDLELGVVDSPVDGDDDDDSGGGGGGGSSLPREILEPETPEYEIIEESYEYSLEHPFIDIDDHYAEDAIAVMWHLGYVNGYPGNYFRPDWGATRAEASKMVLLAMGYEIVERDLVTEKAFPDIDMDDWYVEYIQTGVDNNVLNGYGDGLFRPNDPISRAEALKVILYAVGIVPEENEETADCGGFPDVPSYAWYCPVLDVGKEYGIINGYEDGQFGPDDDVTRGQLSLMLVRLLYYDYINAGVAEEEPEGTFSGGGLILR